MTNHYLNTWNEIWIAVGFFFTLLGCLSLFFLFLFGALYYYYWF